MFQTRAMNWPAKEQNVNYKTNPIDCIQPRCGGLNTMRQCLPRSLDNLNIWSRAKNWPVKEQDVKLQNEPNRSHPITLHVRNTMSQWCLPHPLAIEYFNAEPRRGRRMNKK